MSPLADVRKKRSSAPPPLERGRNAANAKKQKLGKESNHRWRSGKERGSLEPAVAIEAEETLQEDASGAYEELVGMLSSRKGANAAVLRRWKHGKSGGGSGSDGGGSSSSGGDQTVRRFLLLCFCQSCFMCSWRLR